MPEIGEYYSIAEKIPKMGKITEIEYSKNFSVYLNTPSKKNGSLKETDITKLKSPFELGQSFAYGKSIWFPLETKDQKGYMVFQLGMSGSFFMNDMGRSSKNDHLVFTNQQGQKIRYSDPRMFGRIRLFLIKKNESLENLMKEIINTSSWGIDPHLSSTKEVVNQLKRWQTKNKDIKSLLLEQNLVFGIGNYLASEILNRSQVSPFTLGKNLSNENIKNIAEATKRIIAKAIKSGGHSFAGGYYNPDGTYGQMSKFIKCYEKEGKTCFYCKKGIIKKDFIKGRSVFFCSKCQK